MGRESRIGDYCDLYRRYPDGAHYCTSLFVQAAQAGTRGAGCPRNQPYRAPDSTTDMICSRDKDDRLLTWNNAYAASRGDYKKGWIEVSVEDSGVGLGTDELAQMFNHFYSTKPNGMGMGLAISRTIIEAHDGSVSAANRPGGGIKVSFTIPFAKVKIRLPDREILPSSGRIFFSAQRAQGSSSLRTLRTLR